MSGISSRSKTLFVKMFHTLLHITVKLLHIGVKLLHIGLKYVYYFSKYETLRVKWKHRILILNDFFWSVDSGNEYIPPQDEEEEEEVESVAPQQVRKRKRKPASKKYKGECVSIFNSINE